jgi:hypothetical protein
VEVLHSSTSCRIRGRNRIELYEFRFRDRAIYQFRDLFLFLAFVTDSLGAARRRPEEVGMGGVEMEEGLTSLICCS